ncbi:MAG TPA: AtpZ/AtpI family protein [Candidatus Saccharimonadales bacterium]|nr:AtpZ/AtpI family protein [Candidatus Saccharimonadales bacterium]
MKQTTAPTKAPSPRPGTKVAKTGVENDSASAVFISMAVDMTWRLAIAIMVPIVGGYELDQHFNTSPTLSIIGFIVAMGLTGYIMWQTLQKANQVKVPKLTAAQKRAIKKQYEEDDND